MMNPRALVLRAPGINCDHETTRACQLAGFAAERVHINQLIKDPDRLLAYDFLVIPGGFSYGDDLGAGTLLARNLTIHLGKQLQQFIDEGRPVLGICNGFQVLVRAGLLPGEVNETISMQATLSSNASAQFECRWVTLVAQASPCLFTRGIEGTIELPVAHGEGQFVLQGDLDLLRASGQLALTYAPGPGTAFSPSVGTARLPSPVFSPSSNYPDNPNGSMGDCAGVSNARGNVLGLMPHPERYVHAVQHPLRRAAAGDQGDGLLIFNNAYSYACVLKQAREQSADEPRMITSPSTMQQGLSTPLSYAASGVDIAAADQAKRMMLNAVRATQGVEVLAGMGAFAGVFDVSALQTMHHPALVSSTDGVGTKTVLAARLGRLDTIGYDLVNHSVNDLLMQGARPLFFMDYLAMGKLDPVQAAAIVQSVAAACKEVGCTLLGGETAEMPDIYVPGTFDLAGTIVGVVERDEIIDGSTISPGDVLLGLSSSGLHTNGYSLARRIIEHCGESDPYAVIYPELGEPLADALLRPHRCYLREIQSLRAHLVERGHRIKGMAHITGGGFEGNIERILPSGAQAVIETGGWRPPALFTLLARLGQLSREEQYRTFNMGVGMVIAFSPEAATEAKEGLPELFTIGYITQGEGVEMRW